MSVLVVHNICTKTDRHTIPYIHKNTGRYIDTDPDAAHTIVDRFVCCHARGARSKRLLYALWLVQIYGNAIWSM